MFGNQMTINIGIDLGSRLSKIVVLNNRNVLDSETIDTGVNPQKTAEILLGNIISRNKIDRSRINRIFSTGYGRNIVSFADQRISEITCHARGVVSLFPDAATIIDIGGQDSKVTLLDMNGKVIDFAMNDKCAAGTGRFLELTANILQSTVDDLAGISAQSKEDIDINSTCVVFAESEIIGLIAAGKEAADIVRAVHRSIARRIKNLIAQVPWRPPVVFTGGVAKNDGMQKAIAEILGEEISVPENSLLTGALGAALIASDS